jgi:hypothetical protein
MCWDILEGVSQLVVESFSLFLVRIVGGKEEDLGFTLTPRRSRRSRRHPKEHSHQEDHEDHADTRKKYSLI